MNRSKKVGKKQENPSAQKRKSKAKNDDVNYKVKEKKKKKKNVVAESSSSESGPAEENSSESEKNEDSDDEEIRVLFEEKVAARNVKRVGGKILILNDKRGGSSSSSRKEIEKEKGKGTMKAVIEDEEEGRRRKEEKKKKKMIAVEKDEEERQEREKGEGPPCKFPMNRVHRIMKRQNCSRKIAQEAIFVVNKAAEKFLELFCREAYACAFLDHKNQVGYDHLASVVSKRKRFDFLSDIVPQKVKVEDALAEVSDADK